MDDRYRNNYKMSVKDNLKNIKEMGVSKFIKEQHREHRCPQCGGLISIHNRKCFKCETITRLVEKNI
jgi:tRNA(Ile2) C34 agmatinyltransferase TiaS